MKTINIKTRVIVIIFLMAGLPVFAQKQMLNVVYIGDSITQGVQLNDPATDSPPAVATLKLRHEAKSINVMSSNQGRSGFTTVDFLPGGQTFKQVEQAANSFTGKGLLVFSIMLGTNDSAIKGPNGSPVSPDNYFANLKNIIDQLIKDYPNCKVIIHRPLWYSPNTYNGAQYLQEGLDRLQKYYPIIKKLISSYAKTNQVRVLLGDTDGFNYFKENHLTTMLPENGNAGIFYLHPNKEGAAILGDFWAKAIYKQIIEKNR